MAKVVKKKKKKIGKKSYSSGGGGREISPLRPKHVDKKPPCSHTCPSGNAIRSFITTISQAEKKGKSYEQALEEAWYIYTNTSPFPSVCGRVCPAPCETGCNRKDLDLAVSINKIERSIGDYGIENKLELRKLSEEKQDKKIAVVGAGPGGLSAAYQLARRGYTVKVFEEMEKGGGMLRWGIPNYRLSDEVLDAEIQKIADLGVEIEYSVKVGVDVSLDQLKADYDAIFIAIGAQKGISLRVEGEDAPNVFSGVEFLNRHHHGEDLGVGEGTEVVIIGGGDTAIDAARISKRLGANATILYRRTRQEMPAIDPEIEEALEEDIKIEYLAAPVGFKKNDEGLVTAMTAIRMELGEPDSSGRRRPVKIEGSEYDIPLDIVIPAVSQEPDFTGFESLIEVPGRDWIKVNDDMKTTDDLVWGGGDVTNLALVTDAIGHGRTAAEDIERAFTGMDRETDNRPVVYTDKMVLSHYEKADRQVPAHVAPDQRMDLETEVNHGYTVDQTKAESDRCMSCGYCMDCEKCWLYCSDQAIVKQLEGGFPYGWKLENCTGCSKCAEICPCNFIDMI